MHSAVGPLRKAGSMKVADATRRLRVLITDVPQQED
jgi:hypothetical protein